MGKRWAAVARLWAALAGLGLLGVGAARAQEIRDVDALKIERAKASRLREQGKAAEALPIAQRVTAAAEKLWGADAVETANHLEWLGALYKDLGRYDQAVPLFRRSLQIHEATFGPDHPDVALCLNNLAWLYQALGRYDQAEPLFRRSLQIREDKLGKDHPAVASSLNNLATLYHATGRYAQAEPLFRRGLQIREARLGKDHPAVAESLNNLALLYSNTGRDAQAEPLLRRSLQIREAQLGKDHPDVALCLNNLAALYQRLGRYAQAEPLYQRSLQIKEAKLGPAHPAVAETLNNLALLYEAMGRYAQAEPLYRRGLQIEEAALGKDHPALGTTVNNLAYLYHLMGRYAEAEPLYRRGLQTRETKLGKDHPDVAQSLHNLGVLLEATARTAPAAELFDQARRLCRRHALSILPTLSEAEQADFLGRNETLGWYGALSLGLRHPDDPKLAERSAAWLVNGKGLAQETRAQAAVRARDSRDPQLGRLSEALQQTRQELARLTLKPPPADQAQERQRRLDELSRREQELAKQLRQAGGGGGEVPWVELETLRRALPPDGVLVNLARFAVFDFKASKDQQQWQPARYAAWVIPAAGPARVLDLGPAEAIEAAVQKVRQTLQDASKTIRLKGEADAETAVREPLEALAQKVLHPLLPHIGTIQRWVLSPDGALWLVPWAALPLPDGKYAVEGHTLSYAISGRDLLDAAPAKVTPSAPLVLADPDFDLGLDQVALATRRLRGQEAPAETRGLSKALQLANIKRLPATAAEAAAITAPLRQYAGAAPRVLTDKEATAGVFQAAHHPKVVVLSTHGYFLPDQEVAPQAGDRPGPGEGKSRGLRLENPLLRCGLLLAGCNNAEQAKEGGDNGVLTGLQIVGTDLRGCQLVVLSACETGLGEVRNGEGVAGLRQAFQLAGAQSVVATLWQVPDQQSAQLMTGFFENLAAQPDKAEALRQAQLKLIKARRDRTAAAHPYFWAAYTLTGR